MKLSQYKRPSPQQAITAAALLTVAVTLGRTAWRMRQSVRLAQASKPFSIAPHAPVASMLIVGDSTAVGTGASAPGNSLAGLVARRYPNLRIENLARDGAKFEAIAEQLAGSERFDIILILGGGNDVIRMTSVDRLNQHVTRTVKRAKERADQVIVMPAGNIGNAPFFYRPVSWYMSYRARQLHDAALAATRAAGATFVDLYRERDTDPFALKPKKMNAKDMLHPSDAGYAFWLEQLERQGHLSHVLARVPRRQSLEKRETRV